MNLFFSKIRDVLRHGLVLQTVLDLLGKAGIVVIPYYLVEESLARAPSKLPEPRAPALTMRFLKPDDAPEIGAMPESDVSREEARRRLERGLWGFGAWSESELIAFVWVNLDELDFAPCKRPLAENEAYLFGAKTARRARGMNLNPSMRRELYDRLAGEGRTHLLSISYAFNRPAIRFKQKLGARFTQLHLFVSLWGLWRRNWLIRHDPEI